MNIVYPDYRRCGLNVVSSIMHYFGTENPHPGFQPLTRVLGERRWRNVVLMLFDGMGMKTLEEFLPEDAFLRKNLFAVLSAVYPSTTVNVTTTLECGKSPKEHAWLGWTLYFREIGQYVDVFLNSYEGKKAADYPVAQRYIPREFIFPKMTAAGECEACCVSPHSEQVKIGTLDELFTKTEELCHDPVRRYIYTYWGEPDHSMHLAGCSDRRIGEIVREIDERTERLSAAAGGDTLILVTADHGLTDGKFFYLEDYPHLVRMLIRLPAIECRAAAFYVKPGMKEAFAEAFRQTFGAHFLLIEKEEFIARFLGDGEESDHLREFTGDYMALSVDEYCIANKRKESEMKGVHAGLTRDEMLVPLILVQGS